VSLSHSSVYFHRAGAGCRFCDFSLLCWQKNTPGCHDLTLGSSISSNPRFQIVTARGIFVFSSGPWKRKSVSQIFSLDSQTRPKRASGKRRSPGAAARHWQSARVQRRAAAEGFSPTSPRAHWIGPEQGRSSPKGSVMSMTPRPRAGESHEYIMSIS